MSKFFVLFSFALLCFHPWKGVWLIALLPSSNLWRCSCQTDFCSFVNDTVFFPVEALLLFSLFGALKFTQRRLKNGLFHSFSGHLLNPSQKAPGNPYISAHSCACADHSWVWPPSPSPALPLGPSPFSRWPCAGAGAAALWFWVRGKGGQGRRTKASMSIGDCLIGGGS